MPPICASYDAVHRLLLVYAGNFLGDLVQASRSCELAHPTAHVQLQHLTALLLILRPLLCVLSLLQHSLSPKAGQDYRCPTYSGGNNRPTASSQHWNGMSALTTPSIYQELL